MFSALMAGVGYARIWNTTKSPIESAWVKAAPAADQLQVLDAADIASWSAADAIQLGDPTTITPGRVIALDISPMMQTVLGRVFRQKGVQIKALAEGLSVQSNLDTTENGATGSFTGVRSESGGSRLGGPPACSRPSRTPTSSSCAKPRPEAASASPRCNRSESGSNQTALASTAPSPAHYAHGV